MVYTVTFNPSLDYVVKVHKLTLGQVNRTKSEAVFPGGKGINVSVVLKNLGIDNKVLGFTAGFTGEAIERLVSNSGCSCDFIRLEKGLSRINVKIKSYSESEINGQGPSISGKALDELYLKLESVQDKDTLVLAGSIPDTLPKDIYENIMKKFQDKKIMTVVDATKDLLLNVLKYHPFLIKPNSHELGEMFGVTIKNDEDTIEYATKLQYMGARNVLISMAEKGAVLITESGNIYKCLPPKGKVVNSVGAGDSMVAGFIAGYITSENYETAFKTGLAAGSASAFSEWLADKEQINALLETL